MTATFAKEWRCKTFNQLKYRFYYTVKLGVTM